jgi:hypothetical protein
MPISHIGQSTIHTHEWDLIRKDILHVPSTSKNLVSVHKFTYDNTAFFEFHPWYFLLKDRDTKNLLLQGRCRNGLYPLPMAAWSSKHLLNKNALTTIKPNLARWHHRLGMPLFLLSNVWLARIICPASRRCLVSQCVTHAKGPRAINCPFQFYLACPKLP